MIILLSPAKSLDFETPPSAVAFSEPSFLDQSRQLIDILKQKTPAEIGGLMDISDKLAVLNVGRYQEWRPPFTLQNAKQAALAFNGDVYDGLSASSLEVPALDWLQRHVRILSGLYGLLRPLDLIQAYRLEMGTRLGNPRGKDLYAFWRSTLTNALSEQLDSTGSRIVVNCASEEYSRAIDFHSIDARLIQPVFKEWKNGQSKIISFYAKKARGLFARYAARSRPDQVENLKAFDLEGYRYNDAASDGDQWVFLRQVQAA